MLFLVVLFLLRTGYISNLFTKKIPPQGEITYSTAVIGDLVNKDTDGDGIPDWEENLWGTDPLKKETNPGTPDSVTIAKLKTEQAANTGTDISNQGTENLTQTDKFSRDLFATVAAATQDGQPMDQATIDQISNSLVDHIQNSAPQKTFTLADVNVIPDNSVKAVKAYNLALNAIVKKYPINGNIVDILQEFLGDGNTLNTAALAKLDPIILQIRKTIDATVKVNVPQNFQLLHLNLLNTSEQVMENLNNLKLYDTDVIVALGAMSQYDQNSTNLVAAVTNLKNAIKQKIGN